MSEVAYRSMATLNGFGLNSVTLKLPLVEI